MAITTSSQQGIQILSSAANGILGSQVSASTNQIIIPSSLAASNNSNIANTSEVGRLIMIRKGTATEEIRYCISNIGTTLTVHEDWQQPPATGDTYDISYILADAATVTGLSTIVKRIQDYSSNRRFSVLNGGWIAFLDGVSFETHDKTDAVTSVFSVENGGYFDSGYLANGFPVSGSTIISTADATGDYGCEFTSGSSCRLYDLVINSVQQNRLTVNGNITTNSLKIYNMIFQTDFTGSVTESVNINNAIIEGKKNVTDTITVNSFSNIEDIILISTNGFISNDNALSETIEIKNAVILSNNIRYVRVNDNKVWKFINPTWTVDTSTQNNISFENNINNSVQEAFSFSVLVQKPDSQAVAKALVYLYEGLTTQSIVDTASTEGELTRGSLGNNGTGYTVGDVLLLDGGTFSSQSSIIVDSTNGLGAITGFTIFNQGRYSVLPPTTTSLTGGTGLNATFLGFFSAISVDTDVITRTFTDNAGISLNVINSGDYALKVYKYGCVPFVSSLAFNGPITQTVVCTDDVSITQIDQALAILAGDQAGINYIKHGPGEVDSRPMKVIKYETSTGTFPPSGTTMTQGSASGNLVEIVGDSNEGVIVLENWNGVEFSNNSTISGAGFNAITNLSGQSTSFYEEYTYEVDCANTSLPVVYDYLAAKMSEDPITAEYNDILIWGGNEQSQLMYSGPLGYFTERNSIRNEGVWLSNRGTGNVEYLTSDSGIIYEPPVTVSFTLTGLQPNSEVRIFRTDNRQEVVGVENSSTLFNYNYVYAGNDISVYVVVFGLQFKPIRLTNLTLGGVNQSIPIQQQQDRVYNNP